jgi:hypothetical protein
MRIFAYVGGAGYVGVGEVTAPMLNMAHLHVVVDGQERRFVDLPDCPEKERNRALAGDPDTTEYVVPVRWLAAVPVEDAFYRPGLRAQQLLSLVGVE